MKKKNVILKVSLVMAQVAMIMCYAAIVLSIFATVYALIQDGSSDEFKFNYPTYSNKKENGVINWNGEEINVAYEYKSQVVKIPASKIDNALLLIQIIIGVISFGAIIYAIRQFINFLKSVDSGQVFSLQNISRLRKIALIITSYSILRFLYHMMIGFLLIPSKLYFRFELSYLMFGVLLLIIAEVLKAGLKLKSENDLTI